jgi:hypothetical protein
MFLGVQLRGLMVMLGGPQMMPVRDLGMVRGFFVIAGLVMFGGFTVVLGGMVVMVRGVFVMFVNIVFVQILAVHCLLPGCSDAHPSIAVDR